MGALIHADDAAQKRAAPPWRLACPVRDLPAGGGARPPRPDEPAAGCVRLRGKPVRPGFGSWRMGVRVDDSGRKRQGHRSSLPGFRAALAAVLVAPGPGVTGLVPAQRPLLVAPPAAVRPVIAPTRATGLTRPGLPVSPIAPPFVPVDITVSLVTLVGAHFSPLTITTGQVSLAGSHFTPVLITTGLVALAGAHFDPVTLTTGPVRLAGTHFVPVNLNTAPVILVGPHSPIPPRRLPRLYRQP